MDHFYHNIDGWFNFEALYREMVVEAQDKAEFVEIGAWKGRSTAFMGVEIINSDKDITYHVIDHFQGSDEHQQENEVINGSLKDVFLKNIEPISHRVNLWPVPSLEAVKYFADNSLDFVFIDGSHDYESVKKDIQAWLPKVKSGGVLAGDDYATWPGVKQAVDELLPLAQKRDIYWCIRL